MLCCSKRILSKKSLQSPSSLSAAYATVCSLSVCAQDISVQLCSTVRAVVQCCLICCCIPPPLFRDNPHQPAAVIIRLKKSETEGAKFETTGTLKDERWNQDCSYRGGWRASQSQSLIGGIVAIIVWHPTLADDPSSCTSARPPPYPQDQACTRNCVGFSSCHYHNH